MLKPVWIAAWCCDEIRARFTDLRRACGSLGRKKRWMKRPWKQHFLGGGGLKSLRRRNKSGTSDRNVHQANIIVCWLSRWQPGGPRRGLPRFSDAKIELSPTSSLTVCFVLFFFSRSFEALKGNFALAFRLQTRPPWNIPIITQSHHDGLDHKVRSHSHYELREEKLK